MLLLSPSHAWQVMWKDRQALNAIVGGTGVKFLSSAKLQDEGLEAAGNTLEIK